MTSSAEGTVFERTKLLMSSLFDLAKEKKVDNLDNTATEDKSIDNCSSGSRGRDEFFKRVQTFTTVTWFGKPLSPLNCARYGWINKDQDLLQCISCKALLSGQLPNISDIAQYKIGVKKLQESLILNHQKHCSWKLNPCPETFMEIDLNNRNTCLNEFRERVDGLLKLGSGLPLAEASKSLPGFNVEKLAALLPKSFTDEIPEDSHFKSAIINTACTLAICGWESSSRNVLFCAYCQRNVGTWNFKSISFEDKTASDSDVDKNNDNDCEGPCAKKRKCESGKDSNIFQPLGQHKSWCSWSTFHYSKQESGDISYPLSQNSSSPLKNTNVAGWNRLLHILVPSTQPGYQRPSERILGHVAKTPPHEGLRNVRRILNSLTSPTTTEKTFHCSENS